MCIINVNYSTERNSRVLNLRNTIANIKSVYVDMHVVKIEKKKKNSRKIYYLHFYKIINQALKILFLYFFIDYSKSCLDAY